MSERLLEERINDPAADPGNMLGAVDGLGRQMLHALEIAESVDVSGLTRSGRPDHVVILGMGGSAIGGDLARALTEATSPVPLWINRDYRIPAFVGERTLVVASSYSGNTEETLAAYEAARAAGATLAAITTGGELLRRAEEHGVPVIRIPSGLQPRAAVGYSLVPLLVLLHRVGLIDDPAPDVREAAAVLEQQRDHLGPESPPERNRAKQLALRHYGRLALIYGPSGWKAVAAYRWKCQVNENAKAYAAWNVLPELNHNETVGWEVPAELLRQVEIVWLRDGEEPEPIRRRIEVTSEIMRPRVSGIEEVYAVGRSALARLMSLIQMGDYASVYLALLNGVDPTPVRVIDYLKQQLAR